MFILKKGHQPGVYVPLRALFLVSHDVAHLVVWIGIMLNGKFVDIFYYSLRNCFSAIVHVTYSLWRCFNAQKIDQKWYL